MAADEYRFVNARNERFDVLNQNGNGLVMDASMREQDITLDEWINDLRLLNSFEVVGQTHNVALGPYYAKVEETFFQIGASALDDQLRVDLGFRWERIEMSGRNERSATVNLNQSPTMADNQVLVGTGVFDPLDREFDGWGATIGVNYQSAPTSGPSRKLRLEGDLQYYGKRFSDAANTLIIPDYFLLNAQVRYNVTDNLRLYAYGTNLTNEIGLTEGNPRVGQFISGETGAKYYLGRPELGRTFRAAVLYRF